MNQQYFKFSSVVSALATLLMIACGCERTSADDCALDTTHFVNPIGEGADPWVVRDDANDRYLWCLSEGNRAIAIHSSSRLTSLGKKHIVWRAPVSGPVSRQIWAPELHFLEGRWHIYFAASDGKNENHLTYVLRSKTDDPLGDYGLHGPLATGLGEDGRSPNVWAIDMTVLSIEEKRYAVWSGWDKPGSDRQYLFIAPMQSPIEIGGPRVRLAPNDDFLWERLEPDEAHRGLNEAPQVFENKGRTYLLYSCGASWLRTYKLGRLDLIGANPLDAESWRKFERPVFAGTAQVSGVGHSCFIKSSDGNEWWHVFHAKIDDAPGWRRNIFVQPMTVHRNGFPELGKPLGVGEVQRRPSGELIATPELPLTFFNGEEKKTTWSYYGHHQYFESDQEGLSLGRVPDEPVNEFRSGEKLVLDARLPSNLKAEVRIQFPNVASARDAGILFRCTAASVGYDAQRGYFAGLIPRTGLVILGRTDGKRWFELSRAPMSDAVAQSHELSVEVEGSQIRVFQNGELRIEFSDETYSDGTVGLRVVNTHAVFRELRLNRIK